MIFCCIKTMSEQTHILIGLSRSIYYIRKLKEPVPPSTPSCEAVSFPWHTNEAVHLGGCGTEVFVRWELTWICAILGPPLSLPPEVFGGNCCTLLACR